MRWLLVAALLCLPAASGCTQDSSPTTTTTSPDSPGEKEEKFKCESCSDTSDTEKECCGEKMVPI